MRRLLLLLFFAMLTVRLAAAQSAAWQVFVQRAGAGGSSDRLTFVNLLTGDETSLNVSGQRYTVLPSGVLFQEDESRRVLVATPDGEMIAHPLITLDEAARRIDWAASADGRALAWTITSGPADAVTTETYVTDGDADSTQPLFTDGPHNGIRAFPVAFNAERDVLYMDYQPDTIADFTPFRQYASLFSVDLKTGESQSLPGEAGCFCGAGIAGGSFLRLTLAEGGFNLRLINLANGQRQDAPGIGLGDYTQGGDVLIAPDGTHAVYALAQVRGFGTPEQSLNTVFVLVDLTTMTQTPLLESADLFLHPVAWTEDASAVLLTSPSQNGTWKIALEQPTLERIADATYIGIMLPTQP
jgi:hypothetical protein